MAHAWPRGVVECVEDGDPEEVHDQREHRHHLEEEEHFGCYSQPVKHMEVIQEVLERKGLCCICLVNLGESHILNADFR